MSWEDFEIQGFMPDLPQNIAGAVFEDANLTGLYSYGWYPTASGLHNGPWPEVVTTTGGTSGALDTVSLGSKILYKTDGSSRIIIGTAAKLWEYDGSVTITDRSGGVMLATATDSWSHTMFGDTTLSINRQDFLQKSTTGAFSAVGSAPVPKASIIVTCGPVSAPFAMVFDYNDGTNTYRDGWINSAISDPTTSAAASWTAGTNGCANGRLLDDLPGPITAAIAYRDGVIAFKPSGMYLGSYDTRLSAAWSWERISRDIGCLGKNCVVGFDDVVYFADSNGLFMYDGAYPRRLPGYVHRWWANMVYSNNVKSAALRHLAKLVWDKKRRNVWFLTPDNSNNNTLGLVYNVDSQKWMPVTSFVNVGATATASDVIGYVDSSTGIFVAVMSNKKIGYLWFEAGSSNPPVSALTFAAIGSNSGKIQMNGLRLVPITATASSAAVSSAFVVQGGYWRQSLGVAGGSTKTFTANGANLQLDGTASERFLQPGVAFAAGVDIEIAYSGGKINLRRAGDN